MTDSAITTDSATSEPLPNSRAQQIAALSHARLEILPLAGAADQVHEHVPRQVPITVTASPRRGVEPTVALAEELAGRGYAAVPHVAARLVRDEEHLSELMQRLQDAGVKDVFVVAGDGAHPVGNFFDALALLTAIHRLQQEGTMPGLERLGVGGYPEGHPLVDDVRLWRALLDKSALATYVVTQMCFDSRTVLAWADRARREGVSLPLYAGIPGVVDRRKLARVAGRIGVGESVRFLNKQHGIVRLLGARGYRPDRLVAQLLPAAPVPPAAVAGLHVYTLGDIAGTERWRQRALDRLRRGTASG